MPNGEAFYSIQVKSIVFSPKIAISLVDQETNAVTQEGRKMDM